MMQRVIAVVGPTAVGKTKLSIDIARRLKTEIISGDSMLVYRDMNIGTAKPNFLERNGVVHHLVDILNPSEEYSVADFQKHATLLIEQLNKQNKIPIIAGGTGLYVKALLEGYRFHKESANEKLRQELQELAADKGPEALYNRLTALDPQTAGRLHPNDVRRVVRAIEVIVTSGKSVSQDKEGQTDCIYDTAVIGLMMERSLLYRRIDRRVETMIEHGLISEVAALLNRGVSPDAQAMKGIGYKEVICYLKGEADLPSTVAAIQQATRNFAKRQMTWYRRMPYIEWFDASLPYDTLMETIYSRIAGKFHLG